MSKRSKFVRELLKIMKRSKLSPEEVSVILVDEAMTLNIIMNDGDLSQAYNLVSADLYHIASVHGLNVFSDTTDVTVH